MNQNLSPHTKSSLELARACWVKILYIRKLTSGKLLETLHPEDGSDSPTCKILNEKPVWGYWGSHQSSILRVTLSLESQKKKLESCLLNSKAENLLPSPQPPRGLERTIISPKEAKWGSGTLLRFLLISTSCNWRNPSDISISVWASKDDSSVSAESSGEGWGERNRGDWGTHQKTWKINSLCGESLPQLPTPALPKITWKRGKGSISTPAPIKRALETSKKVLTEQMNSACLSTNKSNPATSEQGESQWARANIE